jgi:hypothetical protein
MKKILVLIFCLGAITPNTKARSADSWGMELIKQSVEKDSTVHGPDSWIMESITQSMEKDSVSGKRYFKVIFRVIPEGRYNTEDQLKYSRIWSQNFEPQLFLAEIRKAKRETGEEVLRKRETRKNNPDHIEEFQGAPLETEVYGPKGFIPPLEDG